eukprot:GEZU01021073.1.p2 GENE.GEZU01021073.1~~GEZU01021073.1.p2  ORF type:complete len:198 (+),score=52.47 GEZU01021073.1:767-1360(+)
MSMPQPQQENTTHKITRIAIQSLGSLSYGPHTECSKRALLQLFHALRGLTRSSLSVCMITVPKDSFPDSFVRKMEHLADIVFDMNSFTGAGMDVSDYEFKEYTGLFDIKKLPRLNSLSVSYAPDSLNYAFKLRRRKLYIEKMHMPPEESRQASNPDRPKFDYGSAGGAADADEVDGGPHSCASSASMVGTGNSKLDF